MKLTIQTRLDAETLGLLHSIDKSLRELAHLNTTSKIDRLTSDLRDEKIHRGIVGEEAFSLNTPEFMVNELLKERAREQGWPSQSENE